MGFNIEEFTGDEVKELEGVWVYFDVEETQGLLVAEAWNENFMKAFRKFPRGFQNRARLGTLDTKTDRRAWHRLLADKILLNWKGISHGGKPLKYDPKVAATMMGEYKKFLKFVWDTASEESLYMKEQAEEDEKNSPPSSGTD